MTRVLVRGVCPDRLGRLEACVEACRSFSEACRRARVARQDVYRLADLGHVRCREILARADQIRSTPRPT